jgi:hypothetical protein
MTLDELRKYLAQELHNANTTQSEDSVELIAGRMWQRFIPSGLSLYTLEGALQQIVATFSEPADDDEEGGA